MKKINLDINNADDWANLDWSDPIIPTELKKTDALINRARANRIKAQDSEWLEKNKNAQKNGAITRKNSREFKESTKRGAKKRMMTEEGQSHINNMVLNSNQTLEWKKNHSEFMKNRLSDPTNNPYYKGAVIGTNIKTGEEIILRGSKQIINAGFSSSNIASCINGNRKSHKGYTWRREPI